MRQYTFIRSEFQIKGQFHIVIKQNRTIPNALAHVQEIKNFLRIQKYPTVALIRCSAVASGGRLVLYTAKVSTTPRWLDFKSLKGDVNTPFPVARARKMFSRSSYKSKSVQANQHMEGIQCMCLEDVFLNINTFSNHTVLIYIDFNSVCISVNWQMHFAIMKLITFMELLTRNESCDRNKHDLHVK